jgi:hypothetical protein
MDIYCVICEVGTVFLNQYLDEGFIKFCLELTVIMLIVNVYLI